MPRDNGDVRCWDCEHFMSDDPGYSHFGTCTELFDSVDGPRMEGWPVNAIRADGRSDASGCPGWSPSQDYLALLDETRSYEDELSRARAARGFRMPGLGGGEAA